MTQLIKIILWIWAGALLFIGCQHPQDDKASEKIYGLDSSREKLPYPTITIPKDVDTTSPRWKGIDLTPRPPVIPVSPAEEQASFVLQPGYRIQPVLTEPHIIEPAAIQFDGNGRMYVLELRTYMQDIDATDELQPFSRISRWEDTNNDGIYDSGGVFLDSLVFPRFVVPFGPNTILSMESNQDHVYKYTDTNGDGKADKKELFASGLGRSGNVEHQTSFLTWTLDNWMYSTYNAKRIRWTPDGIIQEPTGNPHGQWGVTQDDYGLVWFQGGASGVPANFQFPIVYGNYPVKDQYKPGFRVPYSLIRLADIEPGMNEVKPDGSLGNVTGGAGNDVFRGDRLPAELYGQYFYGEPVGRIIRQVHSEIKEGLTYVQNAYIDEESEFIQSRDPLFRPVDIATAPDGTMYIVDMYRGIIQEGTWTQEGSYLRTKILQYQMDDVIKNGRIWRLTYDGMERSKTQPRMFDETTAELVRHLEHPNGWWRDKAKQLLILRQDRSVLPLLEEIMNFSKNELARIHSLWTLEGLRSLTLLHANHLMDDPNPLIRIQAIRASESLYKYGQTSLKHQFIQKLKDPDVRVVIQAMQTLYVLGVEETEELIGPVLKSNSLKGVQVVGTQILDNLREIKDLADNRFNDYERVLYTKGKEIYDGFCATCHGGKGLGSPTGKDGEDIMAPAFSGSPRINGHPEYAVKTMLHGLTGSIEGREYESIMIAMNENDDDYIASVISYIRNDFGNNAGFVNEEYVKDVRQRTGQRKTPFTYDELIGQVPLKLPVEDSWKVTASSTALRGVGSTRDPGYAFSFKGWKTEGAQTKDSWFQIELPAPVHFAALEFDVEAEEYPRELIVSVSGDGNNWEKVGQIQGYTGMHFIDLVSSGHHRFVRLSTLTEDESPWMMRNLVVYSRKGD